MIYLTCYKIKSKPENIEKWKYNNVSIFKNELCDLGI